MSLKLLALFLITFLPLCYCKAQTDTTVTTLQQLPKNYLNNVVNKIDKYSSRINKKTEKTLTKLSQWENKIQKLLVKVSPETASRLFAPGQPSFTSLLTQYKKGEAVVKNYEARYDAYRDKLTTNLKYLEEQKANIKTKYAKPLAATNTKMSELEKEVQNSEAIETFIKERKKILLNETLKYLGKSKYLQKINKESFYYTETLKNYKEIFNDQQKAEKTALEILNKIPAFRRFTQENSLLASLFRTPGISSGNGQVANLAGLQTRASVNAIIQDRIAAGGPNARGAFTQNMQQAQVELNKLKEKIMKGAVTQGGDMPEFKPNMQKTKTFLQRLEYGMNFQFQKNNSWVPGGADIGLSLGYKLNDKAITGIGLSYKLGMGSIDKIKFKSQGIGFRSYMDWKLKKQFFVTGGFEMNYNAEFKNIAQLENNMDWKQAGLVGLTKKINVKTKFFKGTNVQLLFDMLYRQHNPESQPILFRIGYSFQ